MLISGIFNESNIVCYQFQRYVRPRHCDGWTCDTLIELRLAYAVNLIFILLRLGPLYEGLYEGLCEGLLLLQTRKNTHIYFIRTVIDFNKVFQHIANLTNNYTLQLVYNLNKPA